MTPLSLARRTIFQPLWERVHRVSLVLMNFWSSHVLHDGEVEAFRALARGLPADAVLFDVGANVGDYSALMRSRGATFRIYAVEPSSAAFSALEARHGADSRVTLVPLALSDREGRAVLHADRQGSTIGSLETLASPLRPFDPAADEDIACTTLDLYCRKHGIARIDFLKIDVEGHEVSVLDGARDLLAAGAIDVVQWEFGENNVSSRSFLRDFVQRLDGFDFFRVVPGGLVPWRYAGGRSEIFATMNYVAVRRGRR